MFFPFILFAFVQPTEPPPPPAEPPPVRIEIEAEVTAYTSSPDETDDTPEINAAGTKPGPGSIACPRRFDLGTVFIIEGRRYTCDDRMNKRYTNRFDIWMESKDDAIEHGIQTLKVEIAQ